MGHTSMNVCEREGEDSEQEMKNGFGKIRCPERIMILSIILIDSKIIILIKFGCIQIFLDCK